jgi:hypothetical protein
MTEERRESLRAMGGPYRVDYKVITDSGRRREMPPARNIRTLDAALAHAHRLSNLGYDVQEPSLDTCG